MLKFNNNYFTPWITRVSYLCTNVTITYGKFKKMKIGKRTEIKDEYTAANDAFWGRLFFVFPRNDAHSLHRSSPQETHTAQPSWPSITSMSHLVNRRLLILVFDFQPSFDHIQPFLPQPSQSSLRWGSPMHSETRNKACIIVYITNHFC